MRLFLPNIKKYYTLSEHAEHGQAVGRNVLRRKFVRIDTSLEFIVSILGQRAQAPLRPLQNYPIKANITVAN
jgi:hypothetical protein